MEKPILTLIIFSILIITSINSGCLYGGGGCGYGSTEARMSAIFRIPDNETKNITNYLSSQFFFIFSYDNITSIKSPLKIKTNISSAIYFDYLTLLKYKYTKKEWHPFYFGISIKSNDSFISNKTFFNNSNIVRGKILIDGDYHNQINLVNSDPRIKINDGGKFSEIDLNMNGWELKIDIINQIYCS
jgi:hypothetical protein